MGGLFALLFALVAFVATSLVEAAVAGVAARAGRRRLFVEASLALNLLTWPVATELVSRELVPLWAAEVGVVAVEAAGYAIVLGVSVGRALSISFAANAASVLVGLALFWLWVR